MKLIYKNNIYTLLKEKNYQKKKKKSLFSYTIYILFFLSYSLYYLALEKCMEGQFECGKKVYVKNYFKLSPVLLLQLFYLNL